jgi:hypothetical protein
MILKKVAIETVDSEKYFNVLDKLTHQVKIETKKEMIQNKLYFEDNDRVANGTIHCSKKSIQ